MALSTRLEQGDTDARAKMREVFRKADNSSA
jgi:hypothetical protein